MCRCRRRKTEICNAVSSADPGKNGVLHLYNISLPTKCRDVKKPSAAAAVRVARLKLTSFEYELSELYFMSSGIWKSQGVTKRRTAVNLANWKIQIEVNGWNLLMQGSLANFFGIS